MSLNIKKGDSVIVLTGKDAGKKGKVLVASPKENKVIVEGVNIVARHTKPSGQGNQGGIIRKVPQVRQGYPPDPQGHP